MKTVALTCLTVLLAVSTTTYADECIVVEEHHSNKLEPTAGEQLLFLVANTCEQQRTIVFAACSIDRTFTLNMPEKEAIWLLCPYDPNPIRTVFSWIEFKPGVDTSLPNRPTPEQMEEDNVPLLGKLKREFLDWIHSREESPNPSFRRISRAGIGVRG